MVNALTLLLPCLFPSWAFFRTVEPSPRIQWRGISPLGEPRSDWVELRPRPAQVTPLAMLRRLFWNPRWNETLYLASLSERVVLTQSAHSTAEIGRLVAGDLAADRPATLTGSATFQFRLVFLHRDGARIVQEQGYISAPAPLPPRLQ